MRLTSEPRVVSRVDGGKYVVKSETGKRLSKPSTKRGAKKRLSQIEYFKRRAKRMAD